VLPPPAAPLSTVCLVVVLTVLVGTVLGMTNLVYRAVLQDSVSRLEAALQARSRFLNTMSHELRSPLHVIIGYADIWREEAADATAREAAQRVRLAALELLQLVESTLNVARLEAGRITLRVEAFQPAEFFRELAEGVRVLPEAQAGVPVTWQIPTDLPVMELDRLKLKEIVQNLVSNALKFTQAGGVTVAAAVERDRLEITVRDTGVGIAPEAQARIFEIFERVEARDVHRPGIGLGLYIVKNLVELMRGTISVTSRPGEGAAFTVRLPLGRDDTVSQPGLAGGQADPASQGSPASPFVAMPAPAAGTVGT
jgi:signal transduction histidine kinase